MLLVTPDELAAAMDWPAGADVTELEQVCASADRLVRDHLDPAKGPHDHHAWDKEAAMAVAVQIHTSRTAPGGTMQALDFQPVVTPTLLGPGLMRRVRGIIAPCARHGGLIVA